MAVAKGDFGAMGGQQVAHDGKTHAGAAAFAAGGEKGIEDLVDNLFRDSGARVCEVDEHFPVFIVGPDKKVKLTLTYPASTGRNFAEILRVIDSLQLTAQYKVATPANWTDGDDVIIGAAVSDEDAKQLFPQGWTTVKPYLRTLPQPNK
jgi:hypothetical protein